LLHNASQFDNRAAATADTCADTVDKPTFNTVSFYAEGSGGPRHITMPSFVKIGQSVEKILQFFDTASILYFGNREILLANRVQRAVSHHLMPIFLKLVHPLR